MNFKEYNFKEKLILKTQNWTKIKISRQHEINHQITGAKLEAIRNLLIANTKDTIIFGEIKAKNLDTEDIFPLVIRTYLKLL